MKKNIRNIVLRAVLITIFTIQLPANSYAQIPAIDNWSLVKTIKQWFTQIQQSQTVINAMATVKKTAAAIGTARATVQEYIIKNKEKLEEKMAKIREYQARAEEYKKMYEEYKAQVEAAEAKVDEVKSKVDDVKDKVNSVKTVVDQYAYNEVDNTRTYASSIKHQDNLAFAMALSLPDGGTDVNGTFIIPMQMAMYCDNISSNDALNEGVVDKCLTNINEERLKEQEKNPYDAPKVMNEIVTSYAAVMMADSIKLINDAETFEEKVVEPVFFAPDTTKLDTYVNIVELAKAVDMQVNSLLKIYSTKLALQAINNYQDFIFRDFTKEELGNLKIAESIGKDDGTTADGIFIIPKRMALTCGLDSETALDIAKLEKCKDTLAKVSEKEGFYIIRDEILRQLSQNKLELALNLKSKAGDYEDIQNAAATGSFNAKEGSPAAPEGGLGMDVKEFQGQLIRLSAQTAKNILYLIDAYSGKLELDNMINFYRYEIDDRKKG